MGSLLNDVNILISKRVGDLSRLEHIKETIENNKQLYDSDKKYIDELTEKHLFSKEIPDNSPKIEQTATIKEETPQKEESWDSPAETPKETTSDGSFCVKCGNNMGSNNFCSKCGQSNVISNKVMSNNKNNPKSNRSKKIGKIILYILGLLVINSGLGFFIYSIDLPAIIAGQYLILSLFIIVIGGVLIYAGKRIKYN